MKKYTAYDDLDWTEKQAETPADRTVRVGLDGQWTELDLTAEHAAEVERVLGRYLSAGTAEPKRPSMGRRGRTLGPQGPRTPENRARLAWVQANGWPGLTTVKGIPAEANRAYEAHLAGGAG